MKRAGVTLLIGLLGGALPQASVAADFVSVRITDSGFSPGTVTVGPGTVVIWLNRGSLGHTSTQDPLLTRWDTGTIPPGQSRYVGMKSAGTFRYHDDFHWIEGMNGTVRVCMKVSPPGGPVGTAFTVRAATERAPAGFAHDIRYRFGTGPWRALRTGLASAAVKFVPARPGSYSFKSRLRRLRNGGASLYSPVAGIVVTR